MPTTILPYQAYKCELSKQDYEKLSRWIEENPRTQSVEVIAYTVDKKKIKEKIDVTSIAFQFLGINRDCWFAR